MSSDHFATRPLDGIELLTCRPLEELKVPHGFTTRKHGFGDKTRAGADGEALARGLGLEGHVYMKQIHGREVSAVDGPGAVPECDGVVTARPGLGLIVQTADCLPILMWAEKENAVSAVHAGWRGTLARVAIEAVKTLSKRHGVSADGLHVALGPAIRSCCFEVGPEVVRAFVHSGCDESEISHMGPSGRPHVDLVLENLRQLKSAGVREDRVFDSERCTMCEPESFYSYRRDGASSNRLLGMIGPR